MRTLKKVDEFRVEAASAVFTKQQAIAITIRLLEAEKNDPTNTAEDTRILTDAMQKITFHYLDNTASETDEMLDAVGVARFNTSNIIDAIDNIIFDVK